MNARASGYVGFTVFRTACSAQHPREDKLEELSKAVELVLQKQRQKSVADFILGGGRREIYRVFPMPRGVYKQAGPTLLQELENGKRLVLRPLERLVE
jgi:hypothetical protein